MSEVKAVYCVREWLNPIGSRSTGSVVAYSGELTNRDTGKNEARIFLEIADCHVKVSLHASKYDSQQDFIAKMKKLRNVIDGFVKHLESQPW